MVHGTSEARTAPERRIWKYLLHKWWFVLLCALLAGVAGYAYGRNQTFPYEAEADVVARETSLETEEFDLAETLFATDAVLVPVIEEMGLAVTTNELLSQGYLTAEARPGGGLTITGRSTNRDEALQLTNLSAESFASVLAGRGLGTFTVLQGSEVISRAGAATNLGIASGVFIGTSGGISLLLLWLFFRQPILTLDQAAEQINPAASFYVQVRQASSAALKGQRTSRRAAGRRAEVFPRGIAQAVWHAVRRDRDGSSAGPVCCVVLESGTRSSLPVAVLLTRLGVETHWRHSSDETPAPSYWVREGDEGTEKAIGLADTVVAIVSEGCPSSRLERLSAELLVAPGERRRILVFVKSWRSRRRLSGADRGAPRAGKEPRVRPPGSIETEARST